jgi:hypothetical protein
MRIALSVIPIGLALGGFGQTTFERLYDHSMTDLGASVQQTSDGGYIMCGISWGDSTLGDVILLKADNTGQEAWHRNIGTAAMDASYCVRQTTTGGYVLCGMFSGFGSDSLTVIRTDADGGMIWMGKYPGNMGRSIGYGIVQTTDGGFAVCGFSDANGDPDVYVVRIDGSGGLTWSRMIDLGGSESANCIRQLDDGGFIVLADNGESADGEDIYLLRLDSQGDTRWTRTYGTLLPDQARGLWVNDDGGFIIAGGSGYPQRDVLLLRTDALGTTLWQRAYGEADMEEMAYDVQQLADGGFIVCGRDEVPTTGATRMYLFRTDPSGNLDWERTFQQGHASESVSLDQTTDGGYVLFGNSTEILNENTANTDMYLVKTDAAGYVGMAEVPSGRSLLIHPNPATDRIAIDPGSDQVEHVAIRNASGQQVLELKLTLTQANTVDVSDLPSGLYCLTVMLSNGLRVSQPLIISR